VNAQLWDLELARRVSLISEIQACLSQGQDPMPKIQWELTRANLLGPDSRSEKLLFLGRLLAAFRDANQASSEKNLGRMPSASALLGMVSMVFWNGHIHSEIMQHLR
jgi:hypothetical protein